MLETNVDDVDSEERNQTGTYNVYSSRSFTEMIEEIYKYRIINLKYSQLLKE